MTIAQIKTSNVSPSNLWRQRPDDTQYESLNQMITDAQLVRQQSSARVISSRGMAAIPDPNGNWQSLGVALADEGVRNPTHWAFGQMCQLANANAGYLRKLPAALAADCINFGLRHLREAEDVGLLCQDNGDHMVNAVTGPNYGRVWNDDLLLAVEEKIGNLSGNDGSPWQAIKSGSNVSLYGSDRDCFLFFYDKENPVTVPNRRNGQDGLVYRGLMVWNSMVGNMSLGMASFLFDATCFNRTVFGVTGAEKLTIRHTASAPDKFVEQIVPALEAYREASTEGLQQTINNARAAKIEDDVSDFLAKRFGKGLSKSLQTVHELEEGRPIETLWDASVAATAVARSKSHQDNRVALERQAGELLELVA